VPRKITRPTIVEAARTTEPEEVCDNVRLRIPSYSTHSSTARHFGRAVSRRPSTTALLDRHGTPCSPGPTADRQWSPVVHRGTDRIRRHQEYRTAVRALPVKAYEARACRLHGYAGRVRSPGLHGHGRQARPTRHPASGSAPRREALDPPRRRRSARRQSR
jgi:hypothetical protein